MPHRVIGQVTLLAPSGRGPVQSLWAGRNFAVRESVWNWGVGGSLIDGDGTAVGAIIVSLLLDAAAVAVVVLFVRMIRNWRRHRRDPVPGLTIG